MSTTTSSDVSAATPPLPLTGEGTLLGREDELNLLLDFLRLDPGDAGAVDHDNVDESARPPDRCPTPVPVAAPETMLVVGEAGIGKTALWRTALTIAGRRGWRVLAAAPAAAESALSFAALGDLLGGATVASLEALRPPQQRALEIALLRREPDGPPPDTRSVGLALEALLRLLAASDPVLVAVDDIQWLDQPSATALAYAARRIPSSRVRVLLTVRAGTQVPAALESWVRAAVRTELTPLSLGATQMLLRSRVGTGMAHTVVRRIHGVANGNPLHCLELARATMSSDALPNAASFEPPLDLAELVRTRLAQLPRSTRDTLLVVSMTSRPTIDVLSSFGWDDAAEDIDRAVRSGLLVVEGSRLRFAHPLFASACYRGAPEGARRAAHERLAVVLIDPEERARHLAQSKDRPDEQVAAALEEAAGHARRRGAPDSAAELMLLSVDFTADAPGGLATSRARMAARCLMDAGSPLRARDLLQHIVDGSPRGPERARNLIALSAVAYELAGPEESGRLSLEAIDEAQLDLTVLAAAHLSFAERSHLTAAERLRHVTISLRLLDSAADADPALLARAVREVALSHYHLGHGLSREQMERATALEELSPEPLAITWRARTCLGECLKYVDDFAGSDAILAETAELAETLGDVVSLSGTLAHRSELALWTGRWSQADEWASQAAELVQQSDQLARLAFATSGRLLVAAHRGDADGARALSHAALDAARGASDSWAEALVYAAIGFNELSAGRPAAAVNALRRTDSYMSLCQITEPRQWRHLGDYVEALVMTGDLETAANRLGQLERWSVASGTAWPRLMATQARGLVVEQQGDRPAAIQALEEAVDLSAGLPLPFVRARTQLMLGTVLRRSRSKRRARQLLDEAAAGFDRLGAATWAARAHGEVARIGGRTSSGDTLTATEQRVAAMVADGLSNKEVAAALVITTSTVEAHLTRIYAKLGVRSRAELARQSVGIPPLPPPRPLP
ncbi:MAG: AAA family ATPase [Nocardioidaceae bacterium]